jgi:hypothetical protein
VKPALAVWRAVTKSGASMFLALVFVSAGVAIIYIVTARAYALRMHLGQDRWFELSPATPLPAVPSAPASTRAALP